MLSVATAPVDVRQRMVAFGTAFALIATCVAALPFAGHPLTASSAALPFLLGIAIASNFVTAYLLFSQFLASRLLGTGFLGGAYLVGGIGALGYLVVFPGVVGDVFSPQLAAWLWFSWHGSFPIAVCLALLLDREKRFVRGKAEALAWTRAIVSGAIVLALAPAVMLSVRVEALPTLIVGNNYANPLNIFASRTILLANVVALALAVLWTQGRTVLHTWLIVALVAAVLDVADSIAATARFTVGWYLAPVLVVFSSTAVLSAYLRQMHILFSRLSDLSMIDGLTEIPNRRYFEMRLQAAMRAAHRSSRPLGLVMIDVDTFKQFNDTYGHLAGDEALRAVAATLRLLAKRPDDVVARWGGEEFVLILPGTDLEGARLVALRLCASIAALAIPHERSSVPDGVLTVSAGVTVLGAAGDAPASFVDRADAALYRAKASGRNTVAVQRPPANARLVPQDDQTIEV